MARHSQHANDRHFFSYNERKDAGFAFTQKAILSGDCFLPFGMCCLSLKPPRDAVATPEGYIYDRQQILECLLSQKKELLLRRAQYDDQERRKDEKKQRAEREASLKELEDFTKGETTILAEDARHKRKDAAESAGDGVQPAQKKARKGELLSHDKGELRAKSFWVKGETPDTKPTEVKAVDTSPTCPMSGKKLRVKDLISVKFEVHDEKMIREGGGKGMYSCAVSKNAITHQQAYLIKPSGQVVLESVLKDCVYPSMTCPITGMKIESKKDLIKLQQGGTGFSAHNKIEATSFMGIRNREGDDALRQGHLGAKGTPFRG